MGAALDSRHNLRETDKGIELPEEDKYHGMHCRASEVAQRVKNLPPMWEARFHFLDQEDPLEKRLSTHSSILAWTRIHEQRNLESYSPWGCKESDTTEQLTHTHTHTHS